MKMLSVHYRTLRILLIALLVPVCFVLAEETKALPSEQQQDPNVSARDENTGSKSNASAVAIGPAENAEPEYLKNCFYAEEELCHEISGTDNHTERNHQVNSCRCRPHPTVENAWYCCNITHMLMITSCSNSDKWTNLHMRNVTIPELDMSTPIFQRLTSLAITDGNITRVNNPFTRFAPLKCLNISNNNISEILERSLSLLPSLRFLNISRNNLSSIPNLNQNQQISVDVSFNKRLLCQSLTEAISRDSFQFVDPDTSFCVMNNTFMWFNSTEYLSIKQLEMLRRMQSECPVIPGYGNCTCVQDHMITMYDKPKPYLMLLVNVDCSNLGLIELPDRLPQNTFALNISNNSITSIGKHFHSNPTYFSIAKLFADHNQISSISDMEGTEFMEIFLRLYLRNNALTKIPVYYLNNVIDDKGRRIYFGGNKIYCDCNSAKVLKIWLLEHSRDIPDYADIMCSNLALRVIDLQEMKICQSPHDWTDYIYYLIATEVLLLIALFAKVTYDYWVFKTAGYLPWPANKMPKLPCDWLCES